MKMNAAGVRKRRISEDVALAVIVALVAAVAIWLPVSRVAGRRGRGSIVEAIDAGRFDEAYSMMDRPSRGPSYRGAIRSSSKRAEFRNYLLHRWPEEVGRFPDWAVYMIITGTPGGDIDLQDLESVVAKVEARIARLQKHDEVAREMEHVGWVRRHLDSRKAERETQRRTQGKDRDR